MFLYRQPVFAKTQRWATLEGLAIALSPQNLPSGEGVGDANSFNTAMQGTRHGGVVCHGCVPCAGSLSMDRSLEKCPSR